MNKRVIDELKQEVEEYKEITEEKIHAASEMVDAICKVIEDARLVSTDDLKKFDCCGLRIRWLGASGIGWWLNLINEDGKCFPPSIDKIGETVYIANRFNAEVKYMSSSDTLEALKNLPKFIARVFEVINELKDEYKNVEKIKEVKND